MGDAVLRLLERAHEMERLVALSEEVLAGRGSVVVFEGPAGIGKTSMLAAARDTAEQAGIGVLGARAGLLERELPWNLVRQLFARTIRVGDASEVFAGASALARPALGLSHAQPVADEPGMLHGLYWLTAALSEIEPILLAVDDAHWGDLASLRYLAYLGARVSDLPVLIVLTVRTGEPQDVPLKALTLGSSTERLELQGLSAEAGAELARDTLGVDAAPEFCTACHAVARGNPFILNELLAQLRRDHVSPIRENAAAVAQVTPESVKRSVLFRVSALPEEAQRLATAVAVLGGEVGLREAAAVADLVPSAVATAADTLADAGVIAAGPALSFVHPLVREIVYNELPEHERRERHRTAADVLARHGAAPQRVASQLLHAPSLSDAWVVEQLRDAARCALADGAAQSAVQFLRRALDEPVPERLKPAVLVELARAEAVTDSASAIAHLEQALAATTDHMLRAELTSDLALMLFRRGEMQRGLYLSRAILDMLEPNEHHLRLRTIAAAVAGAILVPALRPQLEYFLARIPEDIRDGTPEACLAYSARLALERTGLTPMPEIGELAMKALGGGWLLQQSVPGRELLYWSAASALALADRFEDAESAIEAAFDRARRLGSVIEFALSSAFRCRLSHRLGRITDGTADGWQALRSVPADEPHVHTYSVAFLIDCLTERGELREVETLAGNFEFTGGAPDLVALLLLRIARGRARIEGGHLHAGVKELLAVGQAIGGDQFGPAMWPWRAYASRGLSRMGQVAEARELAERELELAHQTRSGWGEAVALQSLAYAAPERAEALLRRAIDVADRHGTRLEHARSLVQLGALYRRLSRRTAAANCLNEGLDGASACGALALEREARTELARLGLRRRTRQTSGADALTPSERRVAQLAADGMTNREIAQSLFVSLRTVETHLTHSYQKLGIDSRARLAGALGEAALVG
jgi:DNA-binding CsgD family transcriptional regulator